MAWAHAAANWELWKEAEQIDQTRKSELKTQAIWRYFLAAFPLPLNLPEPGPKAAQLPEKCTKHEQKRLKEEASDFGVRTVYGCLCVRLYLPGGEGG